MSRPKADGVSAGEAPPTSLADLAVARRLRAHEQAAQDDVRRLFDAALDLVRSNADAGLPKVADIVAAAGSSNDAFYRLFKSRELFLAAIVDDGARRLLAYLQHQRDKAKTPERQVHAVVSGILAQARDEDVAETTRAVMRCAPTRWLTDGMQLADLQARIGDLLTPALRKLGSRTPQRDARTVVHATFATMESHLWSHRAPGRGEVGYLTGLATRLAESRS